ncbi:MAG: MFS transporter [Deltaproteobacteria bacterium]|nr:MAG: MFS transporter [Deltaproteobacteria bacterium]
MTRAPEERESSRVPTALLYACGLSLVQYLGAYMRLPLVPLFARRLGASTVEVGMINAGFMLSATILSLPLGLMSDRLGRKRLILAGMAISCLTSVFLLVASAPLHVGLIYLFSGVGLACFSPAMMSHVGDSATPRFLGRAYGWYTSALYLGMALGPGLGGAVATRGFEFAFAVSALITGAGILVGAVRVHAPSPPWTADPAKADLRADFREVVRIPAVVACWVATFFSTYAWGSLFAFFPLFARDSGISIAQTGLIFTTQAAANAVCRIPIGHLQDRIGKRRPFILWGNALFGLCIALTGFAREEFPLYLIFCGVGATMAATFTAIGAVLSESVETRVRGLAMGGYNTCIYGGFMVSAATLGFVIQRFGYAAGFASAGIACAVSTAAVARLLRRKR